MTRAQVVWTVVGSALALMATSSSAAWIVSRTIAESEARLRTEIQDGIRSVNERIDQRFDTLNESVNQRFDTMNESVNQRFDAVNQRFDALNESVNQRVHSVNQRLDTILLDDGR